MSQSLAPLSPFASLRQTCVRLWDDPDTRSVHRRARGNGARAFAVVSGRASFPAIGRDNACDDARKRLRRSSASRWRRKRSKNKVRPNEFRRNQSRTRRKTSRTRPTISPRKTSRSRRKNPARRGSERRRRWKGKRIFESNQIVTGRLSKPVDSAPVPQPRRSKPVEAPVAAPKREQNPAAGLRENRGRGRKQLTAATSRSSPKAPQAVPEKVEGVKDVPLIEGATARQPQHRSAASTATAAGRETAECPAGDFPGEQDRHEEHRRRSRIDAKWSNYGAVSAADDRNRADPVGANHHRKPGLSDFWEHA